MENKTQKQYPAFAVLTVIALVAALMLAMTNALTEGPIAAHQKAALEAAYGAVMPLPEGGSYVQVTEGLEGYGVSSLYKAQDASGNVIGYCVTASKKGYGGPVAVTFGVDAKGLVTGCVVGDTSFAESAGFGTRAQNPEFQEQFIGLDAVNGGTFEKLSGATVTSTAVLGATNEAFRCVSEVCLGKPVEGGDLVSFGVKQAPQVDTSALVPGSTMKGSADGFNGEPVKVTITLDDACAIASIKIDASTQTPGIGQRCAEDADFLAQFIGKTLPVTVDALSGATITSDAVADAINGAELAEDEAVTAAAPVATVIAEDSGAALGLYEDGTVSVVGGADFTGTVTVTLDVVDGKVQTGAVQSKVPGTPENETLVSAPGFSGDPVSVYVTQNDDGTLATVRVDASNQMAGIGKACEKADFTSQFVGKAGPFALGSGIDACAGATFTSQGVVDALNTLYAAPAEEAAPAAEAAPAVEETKVSYAGFDGDLVHVYVTQNDDGTLATVRVDASTQMAGIGKACEAESFTSQFVGKKGPFELGNGIDACAGATYTSQGVVKALNRLFPDEPAAPAVPELTAEAAGFSGDPVKVAVTLDADGNIATLTVDASTQMAGIGLVCQEEDFTKQFIGKKGPFAEGSIDVCAGATFTSNGVIEAVNSLFAK